jgi:hypothetical protein
MMQDNKHTYETLWDDWKLGSPKSIHNEVMTHVKELNRMAKTGDSPSMPEAAASLSVTPSEYIEDVKRTISLQHRYAKRAGVKSVDEYKVIRAVVAHVSSMANAIAHSLVEENGMDREAAKRVVDAGLQTAVDMLINEDKLNLSKRPPVKKDDDEADEG